MFKENTNNKWLTPANDVPNSDRNVLVKAEGLMDIAFGYYDGEMGRWVIYIEGKETYEYSVICWQDIPPLPREDIYPFVFRSAVEARYLTELSKNASDIEEIKNFYFIRTKIVEATARGEYKTNIDENYITSNLMAKLRESGYTLTRLNGDITISWGLRD